MSRTTVERGPRRGAGLRARLLAALLTLAVLPSLAGAQTVEDKYRMQRERNSRFNLAAGPTTVLAVNQWQCGLNNEGDTCTDVFDSPTGGGGFWPTGSPNQYMFNSGIQVAGVIPADEGFAWAGDTVGAMFMDASGNYAHGTAITDIYNSLDAEDQANWPTEGSIPDFPFLSGIIDDPELYNSVLLGRMSASQQDSWVAYWDGDPNKTGGRRHPMGIVVEQRTMAWNYPEGAENVIYLIYEFTNVTNNALFQRLNETKYGIELPDEGWRFEDIYVAYDSDPDVGADATNNYATGVLPFNLGIAYEGPMLDPNFIYPSSLFHAPFFPNAPGIVGMKYLKSPVDPNTLEEVGMTSLSQHTNGGAFPDPNTVERLWRYLSLNTSSGLGDPACNVTSPVACFLGNTQADVRLFIGSGPFSLGPGESATIAVAMYAAATVATPGIQLGSDNKPGVPSVSPGCNDNNPGTPDTVRTIERAAGWLGLRPGVSCPTPGEPIDQGDVLTVPNSLLGRAMVAQGVFNNKFLLGFAPEAPPFYLVPGDNQVTVVWEESPTETTGDPFIAAAGDPENDLYDPNYREFDVEGYRIYRGTSPADLELIAQFDKAGSIFTDVTCITDATHLPTEPCTTVHEVPISSPFIQNTIVGELVSGDPIVIAADTALNAAIRQNPQAAFELEDTGIPFTYVDNTVKNGFQYYYKVTAFDINSIRSTPSSLESAAPAKSVVPRGSTVAFDAPQFTTQLWGRSELNTGGAAAVDPTTGIFTTRQPPNNPFTAELQAFLPALVGGTVEFVIDSVIPAYYGGTYYISYGGAEPAIASFTDDEHAITGDPAVNVMGAGSGNLGVDPVKADSLRELGVDVSPVSGSVAATLQVSFLHWHSGDSDWAWEVPNFWSVAPPETENGGSRWFSGTPVADPTVGDFTAGSLPGMTIFKPAPYAGMTTIAGLSGDLFRRFYQSTWAVRRSADMNFYWGAAGLDSVIDVTHDLPVPFHTEIRGSYGFVGDFNANGRLDWHDFVYLKGTESAGNIGGIGPKQDLLAQPVVLPTDTDGDNVADGNGFALVIAGEPYLFGGAMPTNTVWTLRTYNGALTGGPGSYAFDPTQPTPGVTGLRAVVAITQPGAVLAVAPDLERVHTVPDPYYAVSQFDRGPQAKELQFVNLPPEATIRIYSLSGVLVDIVNHSDATGGGRATWDLRNRSNQFVASGVYFFHVSTPEGQEHVGRFTVVNAGFGR